jgi:hypothetical protein
MDDEKRPELSEALEWARRVSGLDLEIVASARIPGPTPAEERRAHEYLAGKLYAQGRIGSGCAQTPCEPCDLPACECLCHKHRRCSCGTALVPGDKTCLSCSFACQAGCGRRVPPEGDGICDSCAD